MAGRRTPDQRGTNPNDTVTLARQQRMGVRTQADVSAELARMQSLSAAGDVPDTFPVPVVFNNDLTMRGGRYYIVLDDATQILRIGPTFDPSDPLATVNGNSFVFSWDGTHVTLTGEGSSGSFTSWTLIDTGEFTSKNAGITLKDVSNVTTINFNGNTGAIDTTGTVTADDLVIRDSTTLGDSDGEVLIVRGHLKHKSAAPSIAVGVALGTGGSVGATIAGTEQAGEVVLTAGTTSLATGTAATITLATARPNTNYAVIVTPRGTTSGVNAVQYFATRASTTTWTIGFNVAPTSGGVYTYHFFLVEWTN